MMNGNFLLSLHRVNLMQLIIEQQTAVRHPRDLFKVQAPTDKLLAFIKSQLIILHDFKCSFKCHYWWLSFRLGKRLLARASTVLVQTSSAICLWYYESLILPMREGLFVQLANFLWLRLLPIHASSEVFCLWWSLIVAEDELQLAWLVVQPFFHQVAAHCLLRRGHILNRAFALTPNLCVCIHKGHGVLGRSHPGRVIRLVAAVLVCSLWSRRKQGFGGHHSVWQRV